jgi:hypothetical protein
VSKLAPMVEMALNLSLRRYPSFVYGAAMKPNELPPVLCLHSAEPALFESMLSFLSDNKYETLTCDDYYAMSRGERPIPQRSVLLTFDDGHLSVWSIAYPLLKKYGMRAVAFLIPGRMPADCGQTPRQTLEDAWAGSCSVAEIESAARGYPLCTWSECRSMNDAGVLDLQSHTHCHTAVYTSDKIVGFVQPSMLSKLWPFETDAPPFQPDDEGACCRGEAPALGTPIYESAPRMADALSYRPTPAVAQACVAYVRDHGGETFFRERGWRRRLRRVAAKPLRASEGEARGVRESERQRRDKILSDLKLARQTMMGQLPGASVRHLAFPWGVGSDYAMVASRESGYVTSFWGSFGRHLRNHRDDDPHALTRIGEDFFFLLDGAGRTTLKGVLWRKLMRRRLGGGTFRDP